MATGRTVMVLIDRETRRSRPLPPELIKRLRGLMLPG
jgi:acyl-CoA thioesterase FadM